MTLGGIRGRLLAVWLVLVVLVAAIVIIERTDRAGRPSNPDQARDPRLLLPVPVDQLGAIEVSRGGALHRFERDAAGAWFYHGVHTGSEAAHGHRADPSMADRIGRAFAALGRTRIERQFTLDTDGRDYGVTRPQMLILVYRPNEPQPLAQYLVGDIAPDALSRYVLVAARASIATIPNYQIDNLSKLIEAVGNQSGQGQASKPSP